MRQGLTLAVALLLALPPLAAQAPQAPAPPGAPAGATVRGRVTDGATGRPLRMARVALTSVTPGPNALERFTRTGPDGTFQFKDVPAARVTVTASKPRYITLQYQQKLPEKAGRPLDIAAGRTVDAIDFVLLRAAAITGRVLDELGEPVSNAWVSAMKTGYDERGRALVSAGGATTNDLGDYRISQLPPGDYYVVAAERLDGFGSEMDADIGFVKTAYPSTADLKDARGVAVRAGLDTAGIDIALLPAHAARVAGTVLSGDGQPAANVWLVLQAIGNGPGAGIGADTYSGADGGFLLPRVAPGRYELHARMNSKPNEGAVVPLDVSGDEITGLIVPITRGGRMVGRVVPPAGVPPARAADAKINAVPVGDTLIFGTGFGGVVKDDWTFDWDFLLGPRIIRPQSLPRGWYLKAVRRGEEDVTDTPIVFRAAEVVRDLEIVLTTDDTTVDGSAVTRDNKPAERYTVIVFPEDTSLWTSWSRFVKTARPDQTGRFSIEGLPPARYRIAALAEIEENQWNDPEFLERLRSTASSMTLEVGQHVSLVLHVR
ncbi:MAG: hypothetical protein A3H96_20145 [Acidobacteria bacterium RIFCSPLOWO2_02_FULL_67_36]|nr:MAG: hypothetical protein A3H96_20145 [Acidobacteria bacterium RIFCSPLOWO2_02_FULL_67_36]OFW23346.1 MAG: hypothetical protein A3G21_10650 [Acidobacteria bacterium RIFCSPLOWO2_12_FULL_66_21]